MADFHYPAPVGHGDQAQMYLVRGIDIQPVARHDDGRPWGDSPVAPAAQKVMYPGDYGEPFRRAYDYGIGCCHCIRFNCFSIF